MCSNCVLYVPHEISKKRKILRYQVSVFLKEKIIILDKSDVYFHFVIATQILFHLIYCVLCCIDAVHTVLMKINQIVLYVQYSKFR